MHNWKRGWQLPLSHHNYTTIIISLVTSGGVVEALLMTLAIIQHLSLLRAVLCKSMEDNPVYPWCYLFTFSVCFFIFFLALLHCRMVFAKPDELVTCPYYIIFLFFTILNKLSCDLKVAVILFLTSSFMMWSQYEILKKLLISRVSMHLWRSAVRVQEFTSLYKDWITHLYMCVLNVITVI